VFQKQKKASSQIKQFLNILFKSVHLLHFQSLVQSTIF
jgi:hypothetical protein